MCVLSYLSGNPKDGGILPRALDVLFNSIQGKQWDDVSLKPKMFSDVYKLTPKQMEVEERIKESVMKMASEEVEFHTPAFAFYF